MMGNLNSSSSRYLYGLTLLEGSNSNFFPKNISLDLDLSPVIIFTPPWTVVDIDGGAVLTKVNHSRPRLVVLTGVKVLEIPVVTLNIQTFKQRCFLALS